MSVSAQENGCLIPHGIGHGLVITTDLEGRIPLYVDSSVRIFGAGFYGSAIPYAFQFGLVFISTQSLDVALVRHQVHFVFEDVTFSPSTLVLGGTMIAYATELGIWFVDVAAVWALLEGVGDGFDAKAPTLQVVAVTKSKRRLVY